MSRVEQAMKKSGASIAELMSQPIPHPVFAHVIEEVCRAQDKHAPMHSPHEAYSVILEEVDELWEEVRKQRDAVSNEAMRKELIQIAAMACRAVIDLRLV